MHEKPRQNSFEESHRLPQEEDDPLDWIPYYTFIKKLFAKFDSSVVMLLGLQNLNHGLWSVAVLAC